MKRILLLACVVGFAVLADAQTNLVRMTADTTVNGGRSFSRDIPGSALKVIESEAFVRLEGNVTLTTEAGVIRADEAVVYPRTNQVELRGNVTIQLAAPPAISW